jgi:hypothetical protein
LILQNEGDINSFFKRGVSVAKKYQSSLDWQGQVGKANHTTEEFDATPFSKEITSSKAPAWDDLERDEKSLIRK